MTAGRALVLCAAAACTRSSPAERVGGSLPFGATVIARAVLPAAGADPIADGLGAIQPLGSDRALLISWQDGRRTVSLWSLARGGYVWSHTLPPSASDSRDEVRPYALTDAGVVIVPGLEGGAGAIGLDLETGKERWRTSFSPGASNLERRSLADRFGPGAALHHREGLDTLTLVAFAPATGEVGGSLEVLRGVPDLHHVNRPRLVLRAHGHIVHYMAGQAPDDPDDRHRWAVLRRDDLSPVGHFDAPSEMCSVEDRLYAAGRRGPLRVDLGDPSLTPQRLDAGLAGTGGIACDRHGDEDIVWFAGHVLAIAPHGEIQWTIDLDGWELDLDRWVHDARPADELSDRPVVAVQGAGRTRALLGLDLAQHRVTWLAPLTSPLEPMAVLHDRQRSYVQIRSSKDADQGASVIATFDGDSGEVTAAVLVDGLDRTLDPGMLVDGTLWGFAHSGGFIAQEVEEGQEITPRRLAHGWLRLDGATLRPLESSSSGWTIYEALSWWSTTVPRGEPSAGTRLLASERPPPPPPRPAEDRRADASPSWDLEPMRAAARAAAAAPAAEVRLLAWDVRKDGTVACGEHAVVSVQFIAADGVARWMVALLRRHPSAVREPPLDPPLRTPVDPRGWHVYGSDAVLPEFHVGWPRRLLLTRRPTDGDIQRLLTGSAPWSFDGDLGKTCALVDGDVDQVAWREVTGEQPSRRYPASIERPE